MQRGHDLREPLQRILTCRVTMANDIIHKNATITFLSTALSQNGRLDGLSSLAINFKLVRELIQNFGYRPKAITLVKMYTSIFATALIATGLEDFDELEESLPQLGTSLLGTVPGLYFVLGSFTQGISNAFLTLRIGYIAVDYLLTAGQDFIRTETRKSANRKALEKIGPLIKHATEMLPGYLRQAAQQIIGPIS